MYNKRDKIRKVSKQLLRFWVALSGVCPKTYLNSGIKQRKVINLTTFHFSIYSHRGAYNLTLTQVLKLLHFVHY